MNHLSGLNEFQKKAVLHNDGPILIVAGAGAGKTKTLTHRILHLVLEGVSPRNILAITFTNKAAREMRERVFHLLQQQKNELGPGMIGTPFVGTFHSLGVHILRQDGAHSGIPRNFSILDKNDSLSFVKKALKEAHLDPKQFDPKRIRDVISKHKGESISFSSYKETAEGYFPENVAKVWEIYEKMLQKNNALDFDDLLLKTLLLIRGHVELQKKYHDLWQYVHIDEYQDTNAVQYELSRTLVGEQKNICVVGDADQNIYSWRGANIRNILRFETDYPGTTVVLLEENYRSVDVILDAANAIIQKNKHRVPKNLFTQKKGGEKISLYEAYDESDEARFVTECVAEEGERGVPSREIAVLFRANYQSRALEEAFINAGIPYQMLGVKFFDRKEVKDVLAYLRAALNPKSLIDIERTINTPTRGIGKTSFEKIVAGEKHLLRSTTAQKVAMYENLLKKIEVYALSHKPSETVRFILKESGLESSYLKGGEEEKERLENVAELGSVASKYDALPSEEGLQKFLEDAALQSDQDTLRSESEDAGGGVKLMTVHASKGLEFESVFITGLEQDLFPHKSWGENTSPEESEEERRLFYVALTRARKKLFLSFASVRTVFGSRQINLPSEFLYDIPEDLIEKKERKEGGGEKTIYISDL